MPARTRANIVWWAVWCACLAPLLALVWWGFNDQLTADPVSEVENNLGLWGLRFLVIGLMLTPLRRITGWSWPIRLRRMIGVYGFFYVCLHLTTYLAIDQGLDWGAIWADIVKRPYITIGMGAFLLLVPLAATSTNGMIRRLGGKRWQALHRLIYLIVPLGVLHYYLLVKADTRSPWFYALLVAPLLLWRAMAALEKRRQSPPRPPRRQAAPRPAE